MLVVYNQGMANDIWDEILKLVNKDLNWEFVERDNDISFTKSYTKQLGYDKPFFGFSRDRNNTPGELTLGFIWRSEREFSLDDFRVAHLAFQKFLLDNLGDYVEVQISAKPIYWDYAEPELYDKI